MRASSTKTHVNSRTTLAASLTVAAVIAATRPALLSKVYAATNTYEWTKQVDHDRLGGTYTSSALSAEGNHLIVGVTNGGENLSQISPLYVSSDFGTNWENVAEAADPGVRNYWNSVDVSDDGLMMVAASYSTKIPDGAGGAGKIFLSDDAGQTWDDVSPENQEWRSVVISGDGTTIAAFADDDHDTVYTKVIDGGSWQARSFSNIAQWESLSISDNGQMILVGGENNNATSVVALSGNGGADWSDISPDHGDLVFSTRTAMSADGSKIAVSTQGYGGNEYDAIQITSDAGENWTTITPEDADINDWNALAISDDGSTITALDYEQKMYLSTNSGVDWVEEEPGQADNDVNSWTSADLNQDGSRAVTTSTEFSYLGQREVTAPDPEPTPGQTSVDLTNAQSGTAVKLTTPDGTTITCHSSVKESNLTIKDAGYEYPVGLVDFCFDTTENSNEVSLIFTTDLKPDQVAARKYNPTTKAYSTVSGVAITETTQGGKHALKITYTIVDNGPLDLDADLGEISDPIGVARNDVGVPNTGIRR